MSGINKSIAQNFVELLDCPRVLVANDILQVNSTGTGVTQHTVASIVGPAVGAGTTGDIPIYTGSVPVLGDSNLNVSGGVISNATQVGLSETTDGQSIILSSAGVVVTSATNVVVNTNGYVLTFPAAQGTAGQVLTNDGSGNLYWSGGS